MCFCTTFRNINVHILSFSTTAVTNILHRNLKCFLLKLMSIVWDTMATFLVLFTVTDDGLAQIILSAGDKALIDNMSLLKG